MVKYTVIADVHTDAIPIEALNKEKKVFLNFIDENPQDVVFFAGDYFHSKISPDSPYMRESLKFFAETAVICKKHKTKLRFIRGTESHDNSQLELLAAMDIVLDIDFRIINKVDEEELFPGFKVLYIPEEYVTDMEEYYHNYFKEKDKYDITIGHGLVDKAAFIAHIQESEETRTQAPVFKVKDLHEICVGPIYFGHIHTHMMLDRYRYVSSYSRYSHGEESAKGFMSGVYDIDKRDFLDLFIENTEARKFTTVKIKEDSNLFKEEPQVIISNIMETVYEVLEDFVRIEIHIPDEYDKSNLLIAMLNDSIRDKRVKLKVVATKKEKVLAKIKEDVNEKMQKYKIIFDKNVRPEEKLSEYMKIKYGVHISVEEVEDLLSN